MKKKIVSLFLVLTFAVGLVGCGGQAGSKSESTSQHAEEEEERTHDGMLTAEMEEERHRGYNIYASLEGEERDSFLNEKMGGDSLVGTAIPVEYTSFRDFIVNHVLADFDEETFIDPSKCADAIEYHDTKYFRFAYWTKEYIRDTLYEEEASIIVDGKNIKYKELELKNGVKFSDDKVAGVCPSCGCVILVDGDKVEVIAGEDAFPQ